MTDAKKLHELLRESQRAMADLWAFGAIQSLTEGSAAPSSRHHHRAVMQINAICKREAQRALKRMDKMDAAIHREAAQKGGA